MNIKPVDRTIRNLLESGFYKIPRFQRPYSWEKTHVEDFWDDVVTSEDPEYFIGSFVIYPEVADSDTQMMVVDGQQRLTTITILLAAVRNALDSIGEAELAKGIQKRIESEDIENKRRYILQTETSYPYFQEHIQKHGSPELPGSPSEEESALKAAFKFMTDRVQDVLAAVDADPSIGSDQKTEAKRKKLERIRDKVLRLHLITVQLSNEDDAYLIFETLNTRGKDLGVADLVKNLLMRILKPSNEDVDVAREKWNQIRATLDESAADLDVNRFLHHSWLSRYPYVGNAKLFREIKSGVKDAAAAMSYLDDLLTDVRLYRQILEPGSKQWAIEHREIQRSLNALFLFRVIQPVPLTLAILRCFDSELLSTKQTKKSLGALERFHAQFTGVTSQRTGGGTARMYAVSAVDLTVATDSDRRARVIKELIQKLVERVPTFGEFEANLSELVFVSENTRDKPVVQYLLQCIHAHLSSGAEATDYGSMTIEHIYPENPSQLPKLSADVTGAIGNLLLIAGSLNEKLANKTFEDKKQIYANAQVPMDELLCNATTWGESEIQARSSALAKLLYEKLLKV